MKVKGCREGLGGALVPLLSAILGVAPYSPHPKAMHSEQGHRQPLDVEIILALQGHFPLHARAWNVLSIPLTI